MSDTGETATLHIGEVLRSARLNAGLSHAQISSELKIQPVFLDAIERLDKSTLPSIGYVLGYVRAYANHLGMDGVKAVEQYKVDSEVPENLGMRDRPHFVPKRRIRLPKGFVAASSIMSCALLLGIWYGSQTDAQSAALTTQPASNLPASELVTPIEVSEDIITLKAVAPSWIEIKDRRGQTIISRIFVAGESWQTDRGAGNTISARDSGAFEIFSGDTSLGPLGEKGVPIMDAALPTEPE